MSIVTQRVWRPNGPDLLAAVCADGGLTPDEADVLRRPYQLRDALQHASPRVDAAGVLDDKRHGITLIPDGSTRNV